MKASTTHFFQLPHPWIAVVTLLLTGIAFPQEKPARVVVNGIAAKVNGRVITKNQLAILLVPKISKLEELFPDRGPEFEKQVEESRKTLLQELIDRQMLIDRFNQPEVRITAKAIQEDFQREIRENYQGNAEKLREALRANRMTLDGFRELLRDRLMAAEIQRRMIEKK